jgi:Sulfotransferase domain
VIIWLASYPRSGNTFFRALLKQVYDIAVYEPYPSDPALSAPFKEIIGDGQLPLSLAEMSRRDDRYIVKTHDMPPDDEPAIYLVRDGRDALLSHAQFMLDYDRASVNPDGYYGTLRQLIEAPPFGGWSANVMAWTGRRASTVVVKFEKLIAAPLQELRRAMSAIDYELPEVRTTDPPSFDDLHRKIPQFFREGRVGVWQRELPRNLHALFWHRHGDAMHKMGYTDGGLSAFEICQAEESIAKPVHAGTTLTFGTSGNGTSALVHGWGMPEEWGTWSVAKQASLKFAIGSAQDYPLKADLKYRSFIPHAARTLRVACRTNGREIASWSCTPATWRGAQRLTIPSHSLGPDGAIRLDFMIPEPRSPAELGLSTDSRLLGIGIESLHFIG